MLFSDLLWSYDAWPDTFQSPQILSQNVQNWETLTTHSANIFMFLL